MDCFLAKFILTRGGLILIASIIPFSSHMCPLIIDGISRRLKEANKNICPNKESQSIFPYKETVDS